MVLAPPEWQDDIPDFADGFGRRQAQRANWQAAMAWLFFHSSRMILQLG